jgi:hypothetical protein
MVFGGEASPTMGLVAGPASCVEDVQFEQDCVCAEEEGGLCSDRAPERLPRVAA